MVRSRRSGELLIPSDQSGRLFAIHQQSQKLQDITKDVLIVSVRVLVGFGVMIYETFVDMMRCAHLMCFAAGMGTSLYFDFRTLYTLKKPVNERELRSLRQIHTWITFAFAALWVTGFGLIYIRTGFVLETFSPKLYAKLLLMSLMVLNARAIGKIVFPIMEETLGKSLLALRPARLALMTQIAINSLFCWTAGLMLGASTVLKTAQWDLLIPLGIIGFAVMTIGGHSVVGMLRWRYHESTVTPSKLHVAAE